VLENFKIKSSPPDIDLISSNHHPRPPFAGTNICVCLSSTCSPCLRACTSRPHSSPSPAGLSFICPSASWSSGSSSCRPVSASATPCAIGPSRVSSSRSRHLVNERILQSQLRCSRCFWRILSLTRRTCSEMGHSLKSQLWIWIILLIAHLFVNHWLRIAATISFGWLWSPVVLVDSFGQRPIVTDYPRGEDTIISGCSNLDFGQSIVW
jgi:hypothetical protein